VHEAQQQDQRQHDGDGQHREDAAVTEVRQEDLGGHHH
jgi:hypothetical protein